MDPGAVGGLTKKIGPFPVWAWAAVGVLGYVVLERLRGGSVSATAAQPVQVVDPSLTPDNAPPPSAGQPGVSGITTNDQWATEATTALIDTGQSAWSPSEVENALWAYLDGQNLTGDGVQIVNAALAEFGSPPQGNAPVVSTQPGGAFTSVINNTPGQQPTFTTNEEWASYALGVTDQEIAQNPKPYGPTDVSSAVSAYINNSPLNAVQQAIVNHVLTLAGPPPTPVTVPGSLTSGSGF